MKFKQVLLILSIATIITSCGLKKPLTNPDKVYPNEPDCSCENSENQ